jgi:methylmalonyl-CoA epimerase
MKVVGIDHIGIAVASLEAALQFYVGALGLRADVIENKPEHGLRLVNVHLPNGILELIEASDWERTTQRYLERKGPGVYHVGLRVDDVDGAVAQLQALGIRLIDAIPREGDGMRVAFIHPQASGGALLEMVARKGS